jgi:Mce-associated membrane protein
VTAADKDKPSADTGDETAKEPDATVPVDPDAVTEDSIAETKRGTAEKADVDAEAARESGDTTEGGDADTADETESESTDAAAKTDKRRINWTRVLIYGMLPGLALLLAMAAGYLKWQDSSIRDSERARIESVQAATEGTIALLSYRPDTVERDLGAARARMTGTFLDSYTKLTQDVVIPGAKQKQVSAVATVPAAASVSANGSHAVVLVFVNQTVIVGNDAPTNTASSVRVTLNRVGGRWLISGFDPV